jgi:hypothetical protein
MLMEILRALKKNKVTKNQMLEDRSRKKRKLKVVIYQEKPDIKRSKMIVKIKVC